MGKDREVDVSDWRDQEVLDKVKEWVGYDVTFLDDNYDSAVAIVVSFLDNEAYLKVHTAAGNSVLLEVTDQVWLLGDTKQYSATRTADGVRYIGKEG